MIKNFYRSMDGAFDRFEVESHILLFKGLTFL